jgi:hypothetical protein
LLQDDPCAEPILYVFNGSSHFSHISLYFTTIHTSEISSAICLGSVHVVFCVVLRHFFGNPKIACGRDTDSMAPVLPCTIHALVRRLIACAMAAVVGVPPLTAITNDDCWFIVLPMNAAISHPKPCGAILYLMVSCNHAGHLFLGQEPVDSDGFGNSVQSTTSLNDGQLVGYGHLIQL